MSAFQSAIRRPYDSSLEGKELIGLFTVTAPGGRLVVDMTNLLVDDRCCSRWLEVAGEESAKVFDAVGDGGGVTWGLARMKAPQDDVARPYRPPRTERVLRRSESRTSATA
jgi:hypothetical protein